MYTMRHKGMGNGRRLTGELPHPGPGSKKKRHHGDDGTYRAGIAAAAVPALIAGRATLESILGTIAAERGNGGYRRNEPQTPMAR